MKNKLQNFIGRIYFDTSLFITIQNAKKYIDPTEKINYLGNNLKKVNDAIEY